MPNFFSSVRHNANGVMFFSLSFISVCMILFYFFLHRDISLSFSLPLSLPPSRSLGLLGGNRFACTKSPFNYNNSSFMNWNQRERHGRVWITRLCHCFCLVNLSIQITNLHCEVFCCCCFCAINYDLNHSLNSCLFALWHISFTVFIRVVVVVVIYYYYNFSFR